MSADLSVNIAGVEFKNPVITASGTFGFGEEYNKFYSISLLGGVSCKGTTLYPREGNPPVRIAETPMGILNSVGLQNPGVDEFVDRQLPFLAQHDAVIIANIAGSTQDEYVEAVRCLNGTRVDMVELNISCPNVKEGGVAFGTKPESVERITSAVKKVCEQPLMVKLTPNVTDITETALAAEAAGADAVSLINTLTGMRIDIKTKRPVLHNNIGGMSGPAVFPVALRMVWQVANKVSIPVVGMGGISKWQDAVEMILAGASAIQVGTACFNDVFAPIKIIEGLQNYLDSNGYSSVTELTGGVEAW